MPEFIYQKLSREIIEAIEKGILMPGDKLDSVRSLARKRGIGVTTVTQAYYDVERQGWLSAEPKRGYFVKSKTQEVLHRSYGDSYQSSQNIANMPLSDAVQYSFNDPEILPLSSTAPSTVVDPEIILNRLHKKALKQRPYRQNMSDPVEGLAELRSEISRHLLRSGQLIAKEQILITNGRKEALNLALEAIKPAGTNDLKVAIESPCSFYFQTILRYRNVKTLAIPMQQDFDDELALLDQAYQAEVFCAYLLNPNFNDPTGRVLTLSEKLKLISWAEHNKVVLIEYDRGELCFGSARPPGLASLVPSNSDCQVISISDFYDTVSNNISLGYMICKNTLDQCLAAKQFIAEDPGICLQYILVELIKSGQYQKLLNQIRRTLSLQHTQMDKILRETLGDSVYISKPGGGPCLWLAMPPGYSSKALWHQVIKHKIAIAPGEMFLHSDIYDNYFRITYGLPWDQKMADGVKKLAQLIKVFLTENSE